MRLSEVQSLIENHFDVNLGEINSLIKSYRSSEYLVSYINHLNYTKRLSIGKDKDYNEYVEAYIANDKEGNRSDMPAVICNENISFDQIISKELFSSNDVKIIVPNERVKKDLLNKYSNILTCEKGKEELADVYTVEETKGGEWDIIILYNFVSSDIDAWSEFAKRVTGEEKAKLQDTIHRMYYNRYYVGITRAKNKLIIFEDNKIDNNTYDVFFTNKYADKSVEKKQNVILE